MLSIGLIRKHQNSFDFSRRAKNGTRTRDPNLGKVMLYQLSYFRISGCKDTMYFRFYKKKYKIFFIQFRLFKKFRSLSLGNIYVNICY